MTPERWETIERIFHSASGLEPDARAAFLDEQCSGDTLLRRQIENLLAHENDAASMFDHAAFENCKELLFSGDETPLPPGARLGAYVIVGPLGAGGMGRVYKAQDTRLGRMVAIKLMHASTGAAPELRRRFEREGTAVAALNHPNVCTLFDVGSEGDLQYLVMEFLDGRTLSSRLRSGPMPVGESLQIAIEMANGLTAAHEAGIIHRDLKPSNVMLTANGAKLLDFGIAKALTSPSMPNGEKATGTLTGAGILGTVTYMSPEQVRGLPVDQRSDVWSFGVVLYQMLAGKSPFDESTLEATVCSIVGRAPVQLREMRQDVPPELECVIERCLRKSPHERYSSAAELAAALSRVTSRSAVAHKRFAAPAVLVLLAALGAGAWGLHRQARISWARGDALPKVRTLADAGDYVSAYRLLKQVEQLIPGDRALAGVWLDVAQKITVHSEPAGAVVSWKPYSDVNGPWQRIGTTPLEAVRLPASALRLRFGKKAYLPREIAVDAYTGQRDEPHLLRLTLDHEGAADGMVPIGTEPYGMPVPGMGVILFTGLGDYRVDEFEVTNRQFKEFVDRGAYGERKYWKNRFVKDARVLTWDQAMSEFHDSSGRPGPANWEAGSYLDGQGEFPVGGVSWYEAAAYAEFAGKSLPTIFHWFRASGRADSAFVLAPSRFGGNGPLRVGSSRALGSTGVYDMAGNVREWCWNEIEGRRYILGGAWSQSSYTFTDAQSAPPFDRSAINGFRCVRYAEPGRIMDRFGGPVVPKTIDYSKMRPVGNDVFELYKAIYWYQKLPLHPGLESVDDIPDLWRREKVKFRSAKTDETMPAYLYIPHQAKPPYQCVVYVGNLGDIRPGTGEVVLPPSYVIRSGRAVLIPMFKGMYERYMPFHWDPIGLRDFVVSWTQDLGRSIDYLETRTDVDRSRIAVWGQSLGAAVIPLSAAMENRIRAAVLLSGGLEIHYALLPEGNAFNFIPHVRTPVLMLNGRYDNVFPVTQSQQPLFRGLGTPKADKRHVILETWHDVTGREVRAEVVKETLNWLDFYLGKVHN